MAKIVCHPAADASATPQMRVSEALGLTDDMETVCIVWTDRRGNVHIGWSKMSDSDLAAYGAVLTHVAATKLCEEQ